MIKEVLLAVILGLTLPWPLQAQGLSGETEISWDAGQSFSQYLFYDTEKLNLLTRYFLVKDEVNRGEFALGPTFNYKAVLFKPALGATTAGEIMVEHFFSAKIFSRGFGLTEDLKLATKEDPHTLFQKVIYSLNREGTLTFRVENLFVGNFHSQEFLRLGFELQIFLSKPTHLFLAPFYDIVNDGPGVFTGLRF